jgi:hypothetical protein
MSASAGSGVAGFGSGVQMGVSVCVWAPRRACGCGRPKGARGNASTAWPRRERDIAVALRGWTRTAKPWRGWAWRARRWARLGFVLWVRAHMRGFWFSRAAAWPCRARSTGGPGPQHDAAARGVGVCGGGGGSKRRVGLLQEKVARQPGEDGVPRVYYGRFLGGP